MKLRDRFAQFMQGRYGTDGFSKFLLGCSIALLVISFFGGNIFYLLAIGILVYTYFRMFSRNIYKRREEDDKFCELKNQVIGFFRRSKDHTSQRKDFRFFKCPTCGQKVRVPKGKGKIKIHCPQCANDFVKKS